MDAEQKEIKELREKNEKLREQFSGLLDGYAKLELTDLRRNLQAANQQKLIDFIQRISKKLGDEDIMDVLLEEFLIELNADRASYILPGSGPSRRLAVSNEAVQKNVPRLSLPYFISPNTDSEFSKIIYQCLDGEDLVVSDWNTPASLVPDTDLQRSLEQNFQEAMEEEFNVVPQVDCEVALVCAIRTSMGGDSVVCLQRTQSKRKWSASQTELFKDMCRYAGLMLEQMQLTQHIRDLKDQLHSIIESMPSAIVGMDLLGTITMWSGQATEFFGIKEEDALGKVFWDMVPEYHFVSNAMMDVMSLQENSNLEFENLAYKRKDGTVVYHQASLFTMFGSNRGEVALRVDDVSKQVELNQQLFHAQRMETVGTLAGGLAHDFNNVLGGIVGTLSLLKQRALEYQKDHPGNHKCSQDLEDIEIIESCSSRASDMVKRLLSLAKKSVVHMEPLEINSILENVVTLCSASFDSRIKIVRDLPEEKLWIQGNKTQLEQVLLNLCVNARDSMSDGGGTLGLKLSGYKVTPRFRKKFNGCDEDYLVRLKVADTGSGIALENLDKIFDPFYTTKQKEQGTGLGLAIVDKIVKEHGGFVEVDSEKDEGTTFVLYFKPIKPGKVLDPVVKKNIEKGTGDVLVVDDDEIMRKTISRILYSMGYTVATAASGATALRMCESGLNFNLIILDVDMPIMNGLDIARIVRTKIPEMRILFCTGRQHQYQMKEVLAMNHTWVINKPFNIEELGKAVKTALN